MLTGFETYLYLVKSGRSVDEQIFEAEYSGLNIILGTIIAQCLVHFLYTEEARSWIMVLGKETGTKVKNTPVAVP